MSRPRNSTWPWLGSSCPVSILKNVLLPAPFGPIRQRSSPSSRTKLTLLTALTPPKCMLRSRVWSSCAAIALLRLLRLEAALRTPPSPLQQRLEKVRKRRDQALGNQQHECDKDDAQDQWRIGEYLR